MNRFLSKIEANNYRLWHKLVVFVFHVIALACFFNLNFIEGILVFIYTILYEIHTLILYRNKP